MSEQSSRSVYGGEEMGMTDAQFKSHLLDQLECWQRVLNLAIANNDKDVQDEVEKQIAKINLALTF